MKSLGLSPVWPRFSGFGGSQEPVKHDKTSSPARFGDLPRKRPDITRSPQPAKPACPDPKASGPAGSSAAATHSAGPLGAVGADARRSLRAAVRVTCTGETLKDLGLLRCG